jgi:predicted transcriptional regulator
LICAKPFSAITYSHLLPDLQLKERAAGQLDGVFRQANQSEAKREANPGRSVDQVALDLLASSIDHDEWFRTEVEQGRASAREGRLIEHDDVAARVDRRYRG